MEMLHQDYGKLVKGLDLISEEDATYIIAPVLDKVIENTGAIIADVWRRERSKNNVDIYEPMVCRGDKQRAKPERFVATHESTGALCWVAETAKPLWLEDVTPGEANTNRLDNETLEPRYGDFYQKTRSLMALPLVYRGSMRGILSLEFASSGQLEAWHLDVLQALAAPTAILIWKSEVCEDNRRQTKEAIDAFQAGIAPPATSLNPYRTGFIARPFKEEFEFVDRSIGDAFKQRRIQAVTYRHPVGGGLIVAEMLPQISGAHFGVVDITGLNHNTMVELGTMIAFNKPFIMLRRDDDRDDDLPFDLRGYQCYLYAVADDSMRIKEPQGQTRSLQDVVDEFVDRKLMQVQSFLEAKEWSYP